MDFKVRLTHFQIMALLGHLDSTWEGVQVSQESPAVVPSAISAPQGASLRVTFDVELSAELDYTLQIPLRLYTLNEPL